MSRTREYILTIVIPLAAEAFVIGSAFAAAAFWCAYGAGRL